MLKIIARLTLNILSNAVGLMAAAVILNGFSINGTSFIIALIIFSLSTAILSPLILSIAIKHANFLVGGIALVTTLVGLIITNIFSSGLSINGLSTWILATLIVWVFSIIGNLLLPMVIFKKTLKAVKES